LAEPALTSLARGGWLAPEALVIVEEAAAAVFEPAPGFELLERRDYGETEAIFLRLSPKGQG
jgi:16S rRNA (guanine966-N2)-methyltransferase